jgi:hypothetical protein
MTATSIATRIFGEAAMSQAIHYEPYFCDDALADGEIQAMARRQISVSVIVGVAILAIAAVLLMRAPQTTGIAVVSHHATISHLPIAD